MAKKQIHLNISEKAQKELEDLQKMLGDASVAEVIRSSISMRRFLEKEKKEGASIIIRSKNNKTEKQIVSFQ